MTASKAKASKGLKRKRAAESEAEDEEPKQFNKRSRAHQRPRSIPGAETGNRPQPDQGPARLRGNRRMRTYPSSAPGSITFERYRNRAGAPQPIQLPARVVAEVDRIRLPGADNTDILLDWAGREDPFGDFVTPPSSPGSDELGLGEESDEDESGLEDHESQSEESESEPEAAGEERGEAEPEPEMPGNGPQIPGQAPFPLNPHHFQQQQQQVPVANILPDSPAPRVAGNVPQMPARQEDPVRIGGPDIFHLNNFMNQQGYHVPEKYMKRERRDSLLFWVKKPIFRIYSSTYIRIGTDNLVVSAYPRHRGAANLRLGVDSFCANV